MHVQMGEEIRKMVEMDNDMEKHLEKVVFNSGVMHEIEVGEISMLAVTVVNVHLKEVISLHLKKEITKVSGV